MDYLMQMKINRKWVIVGTIIVLIAGGICFIFALSPVVDKLTNGGSCKKSGIIQQRVFNPEFPERSVAALVVRDDICPCGTSGPNEGCHLRVDVDVEAGYFEAGSPSNYWMEVYRSCEACDATITWLDETQFKIVDDKGRGTTIDITKLSPRR